jgi:hypothetical protein
LWKPRDWFWLHRRSFAFGAFDAFAITLLVNIIFASFILSQQRGVGGFGERKKKQKGAGQGHIVLLSRNIRI